jgi:aspartate 1-decarboxylase
MRAKIHRTAVTDSDLGYRGSTAIDKTLLEKAGMSPYGRGAIYNITNGERFTTYATTGPKDSGISCINGARGPQGKEGRSRRHR